ncbi:mastermind-like domain-containing protein 1 isoform X2 [Erinaceus europaeus]|uniref:Mastermind-like domain-containing protein 1 isoform X2 n=1 Tax=Erinaceus europaeus TaxID=9365 RepID=A0ABM3WR38_ERIEU|nr:mastermind-like domain-containing protein 1 isoform X2 [Erinaceus europaeus]
MAKSHSKKGTSKRRQERESFQLVGMGDAEYPNRVKRPCLEDVTVSMGAGPHPSTSCAELQVPQLAMNLSPAAAMGVTGHSLILENNTVNTNIMGPPFVMPPAAQMAPNGPPVPYYDRGTNGPGVDQELQELLEELTKIQEPTPNELDLEKILGSKPEDPMVLTLPSATSGAPAKPPIQMAHMESLSHTKDYGPSCSQVTGGAVLPMLPSSTGISYNLSPAPKPRAVPSSSSLAQPKNSGLPMLPMALPPLPGPQWHHAHQLKALAASKQEMASKQMSATSGWSGLPPPGLSPPYRPVPAPQPPPFSTQNLIASCLSSGSLQGSPSALLFSMAGGSSAPLGPTLTYMGPDKVGSQQFSPQSSILASLVTSSVKTTSSHLLPPLPALPASTAGPSPPYHPEKLASPALPQATFTPQNSLVCSLTPTSTTLNQAPQPPQPPQLPQLPNNIFKTMSSNASKGLSSVMMQQGLPRSSLGAPEPFTFGNTKPLSHYMTEPGAPKIANLPAASSSNQASLFHYLQPPPTQASSSTAHQAAAAAALAAAAAAATAAQGLQIPQPDPTSFLLQQMMQPVPGFQPQAAAAEPMTSLPRQQENQKSRPTAMTPEQRLYIAQQMLRFQAVQEQVINSNRIRTKASPPPNQHPKSSGTRLSGKNPSSTKTPSTKSHHQGSQASTPPPAGEQQGRSTLCMPIPLRLTPVPPGTQVPICPSSICPPGLPRYYPSTFSSQPLGLYQFRQPYVSTMVQYPMFSTPWLAAAATTPVMTRAPAPELFSYYNYIQPNFSSSIFMGAPMPVPEFMPTFLPQQADVYPHNMVPGGRSGQNMGTLASSSSSVNQLGSQSPVQGVVPMSNDTSPPSQGVASMGPMSPIQGAEPPRSVTTPVATATDTATTSVATSKFSGPLDGADTPLELPPHDIVPLSPLGDFLSLSDFSEVDFIEKLLRDICGTSDETWMCNLRIIDDLLEKSNGRDASVPGSDPITQSAEVAIPTMNQATQTADSIAQGAKPEPIIQVTDVTAPITGHVGHVSDPTALIADLSTQITGSITEITNPAAPITDVSSQITNSIMQIGSPTTEVTDVSTHIAGLITQITDPSSQITDLSVQISGPLTQITDLFAQIAGPIAQITGPIVQTDGPIVQIEEPTAQIAGPIVQTDGPIVQIEEPAAQIAGPIVQTDGPIVQIEEPAAQIAGPIVQTDGPIVQIEEPTAQIAGRIVQTDGPIVQIEEPTAQIAGRIVQTDGPIVQIEEPTAQITGRIVQTDGPIVQIEEPTDQIAEPTDQSADIITQSSVPVTQSPREL